MKKFLIVIMLALVASVSFAQQKRAAGTVIDAVSGEPLVGVTIVVAGTQVGTITDIDGKFSIAAPQGSTAKDITVSFVGYKSVTVPMGNNLSIKIEQSTTDLDEVVIVGYGAVKKRDLTGAVSAIKSDDITKSSPTSAEKGLQGRISGVNVIQSDGAPGSGISIQIRGTNSFLGGTEPLYVIDGVPMTSSNSQETVNFDERDISTRNALSFIDPKDIESMEVLKDASATAIYGSRGANGVIMITTKSGKNGVKDKIDFSYNLSLNAVANKIRMLNGQEYATYRNMSYINTQLINSGSYNPGSVPFPGLTNSEGKYDKGPMDFGTDPYYWQDQIFRTALSHDMNLNFTGSSKGMDYSISGGYLDQEGVVINSSYKRYNFKFNLNKEVRSWLKVGTSTNFSTSKSNMIKSATSHNNNGDEGVIRSALFYPATYVVTDAAAENNEFALVSNPVLYTKALNENKNINFYTSNYANIKLSKDLIFRTVLGYNTSLNWANQYWPRSLYEGREPINGKASAGDNTWSSLVFDNLLMYNKDFGKHNVSATFGSSWEESQWYNKRITTQGFGTDLTDGWQLGDGANPLKPYSSKGDSKLFSLIFRGAYNYANKYYVTVTARRDASSKFAPGSRASFFPSVGVSYRVTGEEFMQPYHDIISNLKVRYSYGSSGNQGINPYQTFSLMAAGNYPFGNEIVNGFAPDQWNPGNKNLKWETTYQHDAGIDLTLFNRVDMVFDYYYKTTKDLLQYKEMATSTGLARLLTNLGSVRNSGFEFTINANIINKKNFSWNVGGNLSTNSNEVINIGDKPMFPNSLWNSLRPFVIQNGRPIGQLYGFVEEGIWNSREEIISSKLFQATYPGYTAESNDATVETIIRQKWLGEIRYQDLDGNGLINDNDQTFIGNVNPKLFYGFNMDFRLYDFNFGFLFQGVQGNDIINLNLLRFHNLGGQQNVPLDVVQDAWNPQTGGSNPKIFYDSGRQIRFSRRYVEDGSYLKLRNVSISYNKKKPFKGVDNIRFTVTGNNLLTFTKYSGFDPEVNSFGSDPSQRGVDAGGYPQSKGCVFGVNLTF